MSTQTTPISPGSIAAATNINIKDVQEISVEHDETTDRVTVTPRSVHKGTTVRFKDPKGSKLRIVFLCPNGKQEVDSVLDSDLYTLTTGGTYHFKCFFKRQEAIAEYSPEIGGVIDVLPRRP
jgi:hypothetical protein